MTKSVTVKLETRTLEVKKLPILRYAELLKAVKELPKHLSGMDTKNMTVDAIFEQLPYLLGVALPDVIAIVCIATDLKKEEVELFGLDEMTDVVLAIIEVNNYRSIFDKVKKAMAQPELKASIPARATS